MNTIQSFLQHVLLLFKLLDFCFYLSCSFALDMKVILGSLLITEHLITWSSWNLNSHIILYQCMGFPISFSLCCQLFNFNNSTTKISFHIPCYRCAWQLCISLFLKMEGQLPLYSPLSSINQKMKHCRCELFLEQRCQ